MSDPSETQATPDHAVRALELERRLAELEVTSRARLVRAELKSEALRAGMIDLDGLKLIDPGAIRVDTGGEVQNAADVMRDLQVRKPWLFAPASSSSTATAPLAQPPRPKLATEMNYAEWQAARSDLLRRR